MRKLALGFVMVALGCSSDDEGSGLDCSKVQYELCDVRSEFCQRLIFDQMRCLRGEDADAQLPTVSVISVDDLRDQLTDAPEQETDPDSELALRGLALLGMLRLEDTEGEAQVDLLLESLLGYYSHETREIVIVDSGAPLDDETANTTLGHEYVHALQDLEFGLAEYQEMNSDTVDQALASRSTIEGEATLYDGFQLAELRRLDADSLDWPESYAAATEQVDEFSAQTPSPLLMANVVFPYTYGGHSAALAHEQGGQAGIVASRSLEQLTQAFLARRHGADITEPSLEDLEEENIEGRRALGGDVLGAWLLHTFMQQVSEQVAPLSALQWRGDVLSLFSNEETEAVEIVWRVRWSSDDTADEFAERVNALSPPVQGAWQATASGDVTTLLASTGTATELMELAQAVGTSGVGSSPEAETDRADQPEPTSSRRDTAVRRALHRLRRSGCIR